MTFNKLRQPEHSPSSSSVSPANSLPEKRNYDYLKTLQAANRGCINCHLQDFCTRATLNGRQTVVACDHLG